MNFLRNLPTGQGKECRGHTVNLALNLLLAENQVSAEPKAAGTAYPKYSELQKVQLLMLIGDLKGNEPLFRPLCFAVHNQTIDVIWNNNVNKESGCVIVSTFLIFTFIQKQNYKILSPIATMPACDSVQTLRF